MQYRIISVYDLDECVEAGWEPISISHHPFSNVIQVLIKKKDDDN